MDRLLALVRAPVTTLPEAVSGHADCVIITFKVEQSRCGKRRGAFRSASAAECCVFCARFQTFLPLRADGRAAWHLSSLSYKKTLQPSPQVRDSTCSLANQTHDNSVKSGRHICWRTFTRARSSFPLCARLTSSVIAVQTNRSTESSTPPPCLV